MVERTKSFCVDSNGNIPMMPPFVTTVSTTAVGFAGLLSTGASACPAAQPASASATGTMLMRCFMLSSPGVQVKQYISGLDRPVREPLERAAPPAQLGQESLTSE